MTKGEALYQFFAGFGMDTYASSAVPHDVAFPYLTYDNVIDSWTGGEVSITVNLWFYTDSEAMPNAKAEQISAFLGIGGKILPCDDGYIWLKRGTPWCQNLSDAVDKNIKRRYLNVTAEYFTYN